MNLNRSYSLIYLPLHFIHYKCWSLLTQTKLCIAFYICGVFLYVFWYSTVVNFCCLFVLYK